MGSVHGFPESDRTEQLTHSQCWLGNLIRKKFVPVKTAEKKKNILSIQPGNVLHLSSRAGHLLLSLGWVERDQKVCAEASDQAQILSQIGRASCRERV